jgi:glycosyltransferase involved in cell wall biosynthesis
MHYVSLDAFFIPKFYKLLHHGEFDVVHSHVQNFSGAILAIAALAKIKKRIAHFRNTNSDHHLTIWRKFQYGVMRSLIDLFATNILAVCEGAMTVGWRRSWQTDARCKVVYNGFDPHIYRTSSNERSTVLSEFNIPSDRRLIIHVGRMDPAKNHCRLARVFAQMTKRQTDLHLLLVGLGGNEIEKELVSFFESKKILDRVIFAGLRDDVPRLLAAADLMIFPSLWEGLPGAVIEARLSGLPVVASDLPGVREIASYLGNVKMLNLDKNDDEWAHVCLDVLSEPPCGKPDVSQTPFDITFCAHELNSLWTNNV